MTRSGSKESACLCSIWFALSLSIAACGGGVPSDLFTSGVEGGAGSGGSLPGGAPPASPAGASPIGVGGGPSGEAGSPRAGSATMPSGASAGTNSTQVNGGKSGADPGQGGSIAGLAGSPESGASSGAPAATGGTSPIGSAGAAPGSAGQGEQSNCDSTARELCDGLDNDCDGEVDDGAECPEGCKGQALESRGYMFCTSTEATFEGANAVCKNADMRLAWIESADEDEAIAMAALALSTSADRMWIGGSDHAQEGAWYWNDPDGHPQAAFWSGGLPGNGGKPVDSAYVNWGKGRPNDATNGTDEDCVNLTIEREGLAVGSWNDDPCENSLPYVCEF